MRQTLAAAVEALGAEPTRQTVWRFGRDWWYQRTVRGRHIGEVSEPEQVEERR
jgi:hypothetical protein